MKPFIPWVLAITAALAGCAETGDALYPKVVDAGPVDALDVTPDGAVDAPTDAGPDAAIPPDANPDAN